MTRPQIIAHRGASGEAPENTLPAFRRALAIGVDGAELDVHLTSDGEPVVIHDFTLERTAGASGLVGEHSLAALREFDAGRWFGESFAGVRIPTLAEALDVLRAVRAVIELKSGPIRYPGLAARTAAVVRESGHAAITISSFDHPLLRTMKAAAPDVETAVLYTARPVEAVRLARSVGASALHPNWMHVTLEDVDEAHAAGLRVEAWFVDEPAHLEWIIGTGVDAVMTNFPRRLRAVLAAKGLPLPEAARSVNPAGS